MALSLVTGYTGTEHVTAAQNGALNAGIIGSGNYLMATGNKMAATMVDSNTLRILDGDALINGRHVSIDYGTYEELPIANGTQGQNRNDLAVVRYERNASTQIESVSLKVVKGTATSGTAADPSVVTGDVLKGALVAEVPIYRIPLSGITVGTPVRLIDEAMPAKDAWDSIPHVHYGTKVCTGTGVNFVYLLSSTEMREILGGATDPNPVVAVSNGDWNAFAATQFTTVIQNQNTCILFCNQNIPSGQKFRVNYAVIWK